MTCKTFNIFYYDVNDCSEFYMIHYKANMNRRRDKYLNIRNYMSCTIYCITFYKYRELFKKSDHRSLNYSFYKRVYNYVYRWERLYT